MPDEVDNAVLSRQAVSLGGYEVRDEQLPQADGTWKLAPCLVERDPSAGYRWYDPMDDPQFDERELFLRLADLPPWGATEVVEFADRFGPLSLPGQAHNGLILREALGEWTNAARELRHIVWVWGQLRGEGDRDVGGELIERLSPTGEDGRVVAWNYDRQLEPDLAAKLPAGHVKPGWHITPLAGMTFRDRDVRTPAGLLLAKLLNHRLRHVVAIRVLLNRARMPAVRIVPVGLIGAAWVRLGNALDGRRRIRICAVCPKWFMVGDGREERRVVCSDACRQKRFRRKPKTPTKKGKGRP